MYKNDRTFEQSWLVDVSTVGGGATVTLGAVHSRTHTTCSSDGDTFGRPYKLNKAIIWILDIAGDALSKKGISQPDVRIS